MFIARGAGQYVVDASMGQGAIQLGQQTINSSGEYALGSLGAGEQLLSVSGLSGPTPHYSLTVRELPVQISGLSFGSAHYATTGTILTGSYSAWIHRVMPVVPSGPEA